ncbi:MAG: single-stranded DNA-binding protein [Limnochordales bacterium]|nr:single-stranded DNA-binding protein [Limnochordales bacterium]
MNVVVLVGRLTRDPELRYTQSGTPVTNLTVAVDRPGSSGEHKADFIPVTAWNKLAENCANYLAQGSLVAVEGRIETGTYVGKDGQKRKTFSVVASHVRFLNRKKTDETGSGEASEESFEPF